MSEKHTEGPWKVQPFKKHVSGGCRTIKAHKAGDHKQAQWRTVVCYTVGLSNDNKDQANAHLIAAAPELLEACRYALSVFDSIPNETAAAIEDGLDEKIEVERLQDAIAKARP